MIRSVMYTRSSSQLLSMAAVRLMLLGKGGDHCQGTARGGDTGTLPHPARQAGTHGDTAACSLSPAPTFLGVSWGLRLGMVGHNSCVFFTGNISQVQHLWRTRCWWEGASGRAEMVIRRRK